MRFAPSPLALALALSLGACDTQVEQPSEPQLEVSVAPRLPEQTTFPSGLAPFVEREGRPPVGVQPELESGAGRARVTPSSTLAMGYDRAIVRRVLRHNRARLQACAQYGTRGGELRLGFVVGDQGVPVAHILSSDASPAIGRCVRRTILRADWPRPPCAPARVEQSFHVTLE